MLIFRFSFAVIGLLLGSNLWAQSYVILDEIEQNADTFTQGLVMDQDTLFISSGLFGKSFVASINDEKTQVKPIAAELFAEGITVKNSKLYMLTWKAGRLLIFDPETLEQIGSENYNGEGWGLTHDDESFLMSDGSHYIQRRSFSDFSLISYIRVTNSGKPLAKINELEFADGSIWANVWHSDRIYKIDPTSGKVQASWDMSPLRRALKLGDSRAVLNGIAYDPQHKAFWITGKLWPKRFLIQFREDAD